MNIIDINILNYINKLTEISEPDELKQLRERAVRNKIPALRKNTAAFLRLITKLKDPRKVLEIGSGSGYSTLMMARALPASAKITTLERDKKRFDEATSLFSKYQNIECLYIDAFRFFESNKDTYDLILLDSQKRDYIDFLSILPSRLNSNGVLITDNILFGGKVALLTNDEKEKYGSGVGLLKEFNEKLAAHPMFDTVFLPIDDGVAMSVKR